MSALAKRISDEMKAALLGGNRFRGDVLRNLKAAILNEEVSLGKREAGLSDVEIEKVLVREVKKRAESAKMYRENNRPELAEPEEKEAAILQEFLPEQLSEDELRMVVEQVMAEIGDVSLQQQGQIIGMVKSKVGNTADGAMIAKIVKEKLTE